jgi:hypothetical protein
MNLRILAVLCIWTLGLATGRACDLCAIYSAANARGESEAGFLFTISEQYIPYRTVQKDGQELPFNPTLNSIYLDSSITHFVPGYNFSERFGVNLNVPVVYNHFNRIELQPTGFVTERGTVSGLGDVALIGRYRFWQIARPDLSFNATLLGGVKFPTGDSERLASEVALTRAFALTPGGAHQHAFGGVHQRDISPGSGSFDGIFGTTLNLRWKRWFVNNQFQYYLRTEGEPGYQYGDELLLSGGPGAYLLLKDSCTLSLQANAAYEIMRRDRIIGLEAPFTGMTAWYMGPVLSFTWGEHFSAQAGVDVPLHIRNNGVQNVPDYRVRAGLTWRF